MNQPASTGRACHRSSCSAMSVSCTLRTCRLAARRCCSLAVSRDGQLSRSAASTSYSHLPPRRLLSSQGSRGSLRSCTARVFVDNHRLPRDGVRSFSSEAAHTKFPPAFVKAAGRILAVGDIHGDWKKAITSLELAGVLEMDRNDRPIWRGGNTTVVQMGDVLDRGDCELRVLLLLRQLDEQARAVGGAVWMLNGNHESLNVMGDFRYVTPGAFWESATLAGLSQDEATDPRLMLRARWELFRPGGTVARELAANPTVLVINDIVFAHGGLLPHHIGYGLERINEEVSRWMSGLPYDGLRSDSRTTPATSSSPSSNKRSRPPFEAFGDATSIMWNRTYGRERSSTPERRVVRDQLFATLRALRARALVIGHTPQPRGLNSDCDGRVWRVDVGMSSGVMDADPAVLEFAPADDRNVVAVTARRAPPRWTSLREPGDPYYAAERTWELGLLDKDTQHVAELSTTTAA